jgi:hypothetical protein
MGNDVMSVELALQVTFDPDSMELRVTAPTGAKLPSCEPFALAPGIPPVDELLDQNFVQPVDYQLGSEYATLDRLLQSDLLGRKRPATRFALGPLLHLPLDGSAIKVDPRQTQR